jgi:2-methylisocitrate lyase-like PEP mutase family enzyme
MSEKPRSKSARLQELIHRRDKVLAVLHPPTATHARIMEKAGCEALFVGTGGVVGAYTGLADVGTATMTECVTIAGWIADSVSIPVIMDGDTGHGGIMAVRRMVRECIRAGIAGIRIDDQTIESKRKTQSAGVEVVPLDQAIARYRAAVDMKNELDPNFVVMAQCYARDASDGTLEDDRTQRSVCPAAPAGFLRSPPHRPPVLPSDHPLRRAGCRPASHNRGSGRIGPHAKRAPIGRTGRAR